MPNNWRTDVFDLLRIHLIDKANQPGSMTGVVEVVTQPGWTLIIQRVDSQAMLAIELGSQPYVASMRFESFHWALVALHDAMTLFCVELNARDQHPSPLAAESFNHSLEWAHDLAVCSEGGVASHDMAQLLESVEDSGCESFSYLGFVFTVTNC